MLLYYSLFFYSQDLTLVILTFPPLPLPPAQMNFSLVIIYLKNALHLLLSTGQLIKHK